MTRQKKNTRRLPCIESLEDRLCLTSAGASPSLFGFGWADSAGSATGRVGGSAIARDLSGNVYVTGGFSGTADFAPGPGATTLTDTGSDYDTYLAKYSSAGSVLWVKEVAGPGSNPGGLGEAEQDVAVDAAGNVYLSGTFYGTAVMGAGEAHQTVLTAPGYSVFVAQFAAATGNLGWAQQFGGTAPNNYGGDLAIDRAGNLYLDGVYSGDAAFGATTLSSITEVIPFDGSALKDGERFVVNDGTRSLTFEYDRDGRVTAGNTPIAFKTTDSNYTVVADTVQAINAANAAGKTGAMASYLNLAAYVARAVAVSYTPLDPAAPSIQIARAEGAFVAKLQGSDGRALWAKSLSGPKIDDETGVGIAVDDAGVYVVSGDQHSPASHYLWRFGLDGSGPALMDTIPTNINRLTLDPAGNVLTTGGFVGTVDFDPGPGTYNLTAPTSATDVFVLKLDAAGKFLWAKAWGGPGMDWGSGVGTDAAGNVYTTGGFNNTADADPGPGVLALTSQGQSDTFVQKLDPAGNFVWAAAMGATKADSGGGIVLDGAGNVYTLGGFSGKGDFDPTSGQHVLKAGGTSDLFLVKLTQPGAIQSGVATMATTQGAGSLTVLDMQPPPARVTSRQLIAQVDSGPPRARAVRTANPSVVLRATAGSPGLTRRPQKLNGPVAWDDRLTEVVSN